MIRLRGIVHSFGGKKILAGVDLAVARGECVILTGAAGSGRTTLLRIAATLLPPASGAVEIAGADARTHPASARKHVAYADGWIAPGDEMRVAEYLRFAAQLRSRAEADSLAARTGIDPSTPLRSLDPQQRRTLAAACALATRKDVILLDEPFDNSEAASPLIAWIEEVRSGGSAVVIATNVVLPPEGGSHKDLTAVRRLRLAEGRLSAEMPAVAEGVAR